MAVWLPMVYTLDRALKQRLLGAVILAALLVILVPELLDGAGHRMRHAKQLRIPDEPVFQPMPAFKVEPVEIHPAAEVPAPAEAVAKAPAKPHKTKVELASWALQVGSFSSEKNAQKFRDELRSKSYPGFIDVKRSAGKKIWRVRIGPELDKKRLQKMQKRFHKQYSKIKTMVVKQR